MKSGIEEWQTIRKLMQGYRSVQVLLTCSHLGIFRHLAAGPGRAEKIAELTASHPEAMRRLLNAAVAEGLLIKTGGIYANSSLAATCLAEEGPLFLGNMARLEQAHYKRWGRLPEAIHTGRWPEPNRQMEEPARWVRNFVFALYDMARASAPAIAEVLELATDRPLRLIDVGGGHGGYSMALARRYPNLTATVFELPAVAEVAREIIAGGGLNDRVTVQAGNFQQEELGHGYDVALLFGVLVSETDEGKRALLRKVHAALVPGGMVAIRDLLLNPDDPAQTAEAALFSLHTLLANGVGDVATLAQMQDGLIEAGFESLRFLELPSLMGMNLFVARKSR